MFRAFAMVVLCATGVQAQSDPADTARDAARMLERATEALANAEQANDRVAALTATVRAYERGLSALRGGLRQVTIRERAMSVDLEARQDDVARLLGVLANMQNSPAPLLLLHPSGPLGTARSAMVIRDVTPHLQAQAESLRRDLEILVELRSLQEAAALSLTDGLTGIQDARLMLAEALADRTELPGRIADDGQRITQLLSRVDTLDAFADGLGDLPGAQALAVSPRPWPLPAQGGVIRGYLEPDAAGITRPGIVMATPPAALLTAPAPGTVRYAGPLLDYGNVMILEPDPGTLLVFAGLSEVYGLPGEIVVAGAPLGLMGGGPRTAVDFLRDAQDGGGASRTETLYIEIRENGAPTDPSGWFTVQ